MLVVLFLGHYILIDLIYKKLFKRRQRHVSVIQEGTHNPLMQYIHDNIIGTETVFRGPFGLRRVVYCDYTASGKPLRFIEDYIQEYIYPFYGNTHTTTSLVSRQTTQFREDAREIIKKCVNASADDVLIFTGSGTTSAIHKLIGALELCTASGNAKNTVVFISPYEHHSNILPWMETGAKMVRIDEDENGLIDMVNLEEQLKKYKDKGRRMMAAFSAASNVTGIIVDTIAVSELLHRYGALAFWDYASAAPYLEIDMNHSEFAYKDAVFCSPHKFVGGPQTPGLLIAKKNLFKNPVPHSCGGGTVLFVTRDTHFYLKDIEMREEGGTPGIIESVRAGLVFQLKESVGTDMISKKEDELCSKALQVWSSSKNSNLIILGSKTAKRLPVFSFLIRAPNSGTFLHHNFVSTLLSDLYGIQARGGCACAGPYAEDLLGLTESMAQKYTQFLLGDSRRPGEGHPNHTCVKETLEIMKPGFTRLNIPYFMCDESVHFVLEAVDMVAKHGWKLLPQYTYDANKGSWRHNDFSNTHAQPFFSLHDICYKDEGGLTVDNDMSPSLVCDKSFDEIADEAKIIFEYAVGESKNVKNNWPQLDDLLPADMRHLVWFMRPEDALMYLQEERHYGESKGKLTRTELPFVPR